MRTHQELNITFAELGALLGTRALLADGYLENADGATVADAESHKFNMSISCLTEGCGSIACIGGTMAMIMGMGANAADKYVFDGGHTGALRTLFFPHVLDHVLHWNDIANTDAVDAINRFLDGEAPWIAPEGDDGEAEVDADAEA